MGRRANGKSQEVRKFRLVTRSSNDPYANDPNAPPLVLEPVVNARMLKKTGLTEAELMAIPECLAQHREAFADPDAQPRDHDASLPALASDGEDGEFDEEDLDGDCYFPKDGYNYEQHLKTIGKSHKSGGGVVGAILEASEKAPVEEIRVEQPVNSEEREVDLALVEDEAYEELEDGTLDDMMGGLAADEDVMLWGETGAQDLELPDLATFKAMHAARLALERGDDDCDEYDCQVDYGAAACRGGGAIGSAPTDAEFDDFFNAEYGEENDIGACDEEEIEGHVSVERCEEILDEYIESKNHETQKLRSLNEPQAHKRNERLDDVPRVIEETKAIIERHYETAEDEESESDTELGGEDSDSESRTWDCESVLSTLSNLSNRPGKIGSIKSIKKPTATMKPVKEEDEEEDDEDEDDIVELPDVVTDRPKNETAEEKRQRKAAVKEMRRICRQMKKESKQTFKSEAAKLPANQAKTADVRQHSRCFRL